MRHRGQWSPLERALSIIGNHWTLLIVLALAREPQRPVQLRRRVVGISGAVLDRHVQQMVASGLLSRRRYREMPPRVELALTEAGQQLLPIAGALAQWGMQHAWSAPAAREGVRIVALLELLPMLLEDAGRLPDGTLEMVCEQDEARLARRFAAGPGGLRALTEDERATPQAWVVGDTPAWIAALGPERDHTGLRFSGRDTLARAVLAALPATTTVAPAPTTPTAPPPPHRAPAEP